MLVAALLAAAQSPPMVALRPPPEQWGILGPYEFCAEEFSVRLEENEVVAWSHLGAEQYSYEIIWSERSMSVNRSGGYRSPDFAPTPVSLPLSPVSEHSVRSLDDDVPGGLTVVEPGGNSRRVVMYFIRYDLHGTTRVPRPLLLNAISDRPDLALVPAGRVDPRPLAERGCTPTRLDPAAAGDIIHRPSAR